MASVGGSQTKCILFRADKSLNSAKILSNPDILVVHTSEDQKSVGSIPVQEKLFEMSYSIRRDDCQTVLSCILMVLILTFKS